LGRFDAGRGQQMKQTCENLTNKLETYVILLLLFGAMIFKT